MSERRVSAAGVDESDTRAAGLRRNAPPRRGAQQSRAATPGDEDGLRSGDNRNLITLFFPYLVCRVMFCVGHTAEKPSMLAENRRGCTGALLGALAASCTLAFLTPPVPWTATPQLSNHDVPNAQVTYADVPYAAKQRRIQTSAMPSSLLSVALLLLAVLLMIGEAIIKRHTAAVGASPAVSVRYPSPSVSRRCDAKVLSPPENRYTDEMGSSDSDSSWLSQSRSFHGSPTPSPPESPERHRGSSEQRGASALRQPREHGSHAKSRHVSFSLGCF